MRSVLIAVFDGLQMAQVTPALMPNLSALAAEGVTFENHHAAFPTVTRTNAASIVTGRHPGAHGLAANSLLVREFNPDRAIPAMEPELAQVAQSTGRVLLAPTLGDILSKYGREYVAVGVGTSGNAYVHNPNAERSGGATIHPDFCLPYSLHDEIIGRFGTWPKKVLPNAAQMAHAVRVMTEYVLPQRNPTVSLIWFSEPDSTQHVEGVGSELAKKAIGAADEQFGRLLGWLQDTGRAAETDVMVVSDHGYSTITGVVDIDAQVREAGFPSGGRPGGVVVAPNGGSVLFYTHESDRPTANRLAAWLMGQPWCGTLVASEAVAGIPGTLPAVLVGDEGARAPELTMSFRWEPNANAAGFAGHVYSSSGAPSLGQHGSMSPHEMRNVLIAQGPSFKRGGVILDTPSGNIDLAPTILRVLDVASALLSNDADVAAMDGRVLEEALRDGPDPHTVRWSTEVHRAEHKVKGGIYHQQITISRVGTTTYLDEGRASLDAG